MSENPEIGDDTRPAAHGRHRCTLCNEEFSDYRPAWNHVREAHPEVARGDIVSHIAVPETPRESESGRTPEKRVSAAGAPQVRLLATGKQSRAFLLAHWSQLIEGLQHSSLGFYQAIEEALARREIPDAALARVDYHESGLLSARREYLRVTRGAQAADICAAPFGSGFFVSWWLSEARPGPLLPTIATLVVVIAAVRSLGIFFGLGALVVAFFVVGALISQEEASWHAWVFAVPYIGPLWERLFRPLTFYRYDSMLMFKSALQQAVLEVIDSVTDAKGIRKLSELERKPILRDFFRR